MRAAPRPANNPDARAPNKEVKSAVEKLSKCLSVEELTGVPSLEPFFMGDESENVSQCDVAVDEVIKQLDKINGNSSVVPDGIQSRALKEFKDEIAKLLTVLSLL